MPVIPGNITVYGPYTREDGRQHVIIITKNMWGQEVERQTMSYPKFLMENYLWRELGPDETVDHIDNDFTNNDWDNLRVLSRPAHCAADALRVVPITLPCSWCGNLVTLSNGQRSKRASVKAGPFCSRSCSGKYGAFVSNGGDPMQRQEFQVEYYRTK